MTSYDLHKLRADLMRDEGLRLKPYRDTRGVLSIGYGRSLDTKGISQAEAEYLLACDILDVTGALDRSIPWWRLLDESRQRALMNMGFQLGPGGLLRFKKMLASMKRRQFKEAAMQALDSEWARQTPARAKRIAKLIEGD